MNKQVYRVKEFCDCYAISQSALYREISSGRIQTLKRGRTTLITKTAAENWMKGLELHSQFQREREGHPMRHLLRAVISRPATIRDDEDSGLKCRAWLCR